MLTSQRNVSSNQIDRQKLCITTVRHSQIKNVKPEKKMYLSVKQCILIDFVLMNRLADLPKKKIEARMVFFRVTFCAHVYLLLRSTCMYENERDGMTSVCTGLVFYFIFFSFYRFRSFVVTQCSRYFVIGIKCILNVSFGSICVLTMIRWYPKRIAY